MPLPAPRRPKPASGQAGRFPDPFLRACECLKDEGEMPKKNFYFLLAKPGYILQHVGVERR